MTRGRGGVKFLLAAVRIHPIPIQYKTDFQLGGGWGNFFRRLVNEQL